MNIGKSYKPINVSFSGSGVEIAGFLDSIQYLKKSDNILSFFLNSFKYLYEDWNSYMPKFIILGKYQCYRTFLFPKVHE